jgi:Kef-type K+ transport system membrane component KefB
MTDNTIVFSIFLIFTGAAFLSTFAMYARQSLLVAYMVLGVALGPWGLKWVNDAYVVHQIGDVGIVFLLFLLGLHLQPSNLWRMLRKVTPIAFFSSIAFFSLGYLVALAWNFSYNECLVIAAAMMFSSTIIGLKLMPSSAVHTTPVGEMMVGILLFQDLIAIMVLLALQVATIDSFGFQDIGLVVFALPALMVFAFLFEHYVLLKLFNRFGRAREYMFLLAIAWCLSMSELSAFFGLSHEIGAFIAGVSIANDSIAAYLAECLQPVRDFFLVLFFFSVGAHFNLDYFSQIVLPALLLGGIMLGCKPFIFKTLSVYVGESNEFGWELGFRLGQISEFSLLVAYIADNHSLIRAQASNLIQATTMLTFLISSYMVSLKYDTPLGLVDDDSLRNV